MLFDGCLQLFDVLGSPLSKGGLSLAVALLPLFGGCIYLTVGELWLMEGIGGGRTGFLPPFLFWT